MTIFLSGGLWTLVRNGKESFALARSAIYFDKIGNEIFES